MAYSRTKMAFCVAFALLSATTGDAKTNLRPYIARLQHRSAKAAITATPSASAEAKPSHTEVTELIAVKSMPAPASQPTEPAQPALKQLTDDLEEVKQLRTNVRTAEQALAADVSLLRESTTLERKASSATARTAAHKQVQDAESVVRAAEVVVKESRENSVAIAREALNEANDVQHAADELTAVAMKELKTRAHAKSPEAVKPEEQTPESQAPKPQPPKKQLKVHSKPHGFKLRKAKAQASSGVHAAAKKPMKAAATKTKPSVKTDVIVPQGHIEKKVAKSAQVRHFAPTGPLLRKLFAKAVTPQGHAKISPPATPATASIQANRKKHASVVPPKPMQRKAPTQASKVRHEQKTAPHEQTKVPAPPQAHVQVKAALARNVAPPPAQMTPPATTDTDVDSDDAAAESDSTQSDQVGPSEPEDKADDDLY